MSFNGTHVNGNASPVHGIVAKCHEIAMVEKYQIIECNAELALPSLWSTKATHLKFPNHSYWCGKMSTRKLDSEWYHSSARLCPEIRHIIEHSYAITKTTSAIIYLNINRTVMKYSPAIDMFFMTAEDPSL